MTGPVLGVIGGRGGVGASTFAAALADSAEAVLVDLDWISGGIDVLLGIEDVPGARWSALRLRGGWLDPEVLAAGLPRWGPVAVLAADAPDIEPAPVDQVVGAASELGTVVLDLPRGPCAERDAAVAHCTLVVQVVDGDLRGVIAARAVLDRLGAAHTGVLVRRGGLPPAEAAELVGVPLLGVLPPLRAAGGSLPGRVPRGLVRVAAGVLDGVGV
ncbi:MAG: flp pilus assembly protein FlpE [Pseudonocardiales bacterium]|nr:flp pilus assembly protein FlpE [Pseudonocardiales bacterium]